MLSLRELQLRFAAALAPIGGRIDPTLLPLVSGRGPLGPVERLAVYADMSRARLVDVLRDDFPRVAAVLGDEAFQALAGRYLGRHPSAHPSVRHVGRWFADFVAGETALAPFLGDLARLEWARVDVFDAPDAEPLRLSDLESIPPARWPMLSLRPIPACRVIECAWPAHELWSALDAGVPVAELDDRPRATTIRVWREDWSVSHAAMGELERRAFPLLHRGEPFAALCAALDADLDAETAARAVGSLLMRWLEDRLLARPSDLAPANEPR
jgi:hypothetical protein